MGELSEVRRGAVRRLIEQVPDRAIRSLESALAHGGRGDRSMAMVKDMVNAEVLERRVRSAVLAPLMPLCAPPRDGLLRLAFPYTAPALTWRGLKAADPQGVGQAVRAGLHLRADDDAPALFDELALRAAKGLRAEEPAFAPLRQALEPRGPAAAEQFARALALTPLARQALGRLPVWVRTLSGDYAASIRLAFRDAVTVNEDAGPVFIEILFGHLEEPHQVLRLISLVMDRPSDRYLAASELASFGDRLLGDLDRCIEEVRRFDASRGLEGGVSLAVSVHTGVAIVQEFEQWLEIKREGPWGSRLTRQRRALAMAVEARLREVETAVTAALPLASGRSTARTVRDAPRLAVDPDPAAVVRARALLAFLYECRLSASHGGFGSVRAKVVDALDPRIDQYVEDLLEMLHLGEEPADRVRAYLEIAGEFMGLVRDPKAADIVRRRAAVA
ncbi:MAG: hypothetical protein B7Y99_02955 [Caulobacterales bacterium 32-69-10]|nr:MAG: hypothetical protein B7Y99_02955 [Caulobacterales bacterium 32-69-10]